MKNLVEDVIEMLNAKLREKNVQIEYEENIPDAWGDRQRIYEVVQNLVENAIKFSGNEDKPHIEIGAKTIDNQIYYFVKDNGIGINEKYHEKIFSIFDKLDQKSEGSGVGLSLVKRIVEVHGGSVLIESEGENKGATFSFSLGTKDKIVRSEE